MPQLHRFLIFLVKDLIDLTALRSLTLKGGKASRRHHLHRGWKS